MDPFYTISVKIDILFSSYLNRPDIAPSSLLI